MAKKTPMRKCVLSGEMKPKKDMVRIVRNPDKSVAIDPTGKKKWPWCLCIDGSSTT